MSNDDYKQTEFWKGEFGDYYVDRNDSIEKLNESYVKSTGISVEQIFRNFFDSMDRENTILELGCNIGLKLSILKKMGFKNLFGLEINKKAYEIAKRNNPEITFINSSIEYCDFHGKKFDVVFTAGVLIHIDPKILESAVKKMIDLTNQYIFGFEYYSDDLVQVEYREHSDVLWKQNFPNLFRKLYPKIQTVKEEKFYHANMDLWDIAYLLKI
jgi:pseudaminic acid biosynthesis-associated methylase